MTGDGQNKGYVLGEYHPIASEPILYQQSSSEQQDEMYRARYIYRVDGIGWLVGRKVGEKWGWLKNPSLSTTLPRSGWQYGDTVTNTFLADDSINVNEGRLISDCTEIKVTLTGAALEKWPKGAGVFKLQDHRFFNGRHIFKNEENWLLHCDNEGSWSIGDKLSYFGIKSKSAHMVPSSADEWIYKSGSGSYKTTVELTCTSTN